jgi:hypothetical protein
MSLAIDTQKPASPYNDRRVELPAIVLLDDAEHQDLLDASQAPENRGELRRAQTHCMATQVLLLNQVALQEALRE